jgi:hypothetical protein
MANVNIIASARIVSNGGAITSDVYSSDSSTDIVKGELCYLSAGTIIPVATTHLTAQKIENDTPPFDAAAQYFISLLAVDASVSLTDTIPVQQIDEDTIMEGYVVDATGDSVVMDSTDIGTVCEGYIDTNGRWAINNATTKGVFIIVDVMDQYDPYRNPDAEGYEEDSTGVRHDRVKFRLLKANLQ